MIQIRDSKRNTPDGWHHVSATFTNKVPRDVYLDGYGGRHYFAWQWKAMVWFQKLRDRVLRRKRYAPVTQPTVYDVALTAEQVRALYEGKPFWVKVK